MWFLVNKLQLATLCLFYLLPFSLSAYQPAKQRPLDFSLIIQSQSLKVNFATVTNKISTDQLGVSWYEPFSQSFHAGLELGYTEMTQENNPVLSAQFTSGQYAGILLRLIPLETTSLSLKLDLNYRYNRTEGSSSSQNTQFSWGEAVLSAELLYWPADTIGLYAAAEYQQLSGEQRDTGTISQIRSFTEKEQQGARFGLQLVADSDGIVGIERFLGYRNGGRIYFKRKF